MPQIRPFSSFLKRKPELLSWISLFTTTILAIYFYIFMEWLFFATKPSFMDSMTFAARLGVLVFPGLLLVGISLPVLFILFAGSLLPWGPKYRNALLCIGAAVPAAFLAATALMMLDNFTHTVLKFSIVNTKGIQRGLYGLLFLVILGRAILWSARRVLAAQRKKQPDTSLKTQVYASAAVLLLSIPLGGNLFFGGSTADPTLVTGAPVHRPNILLIGSDGLDADKTSIYGSQPDTTPFLREFAENSLLALNNFPNASITSGSLVSIFTGKFPSQTRLLYPPDILKGNDSFQHLPAILKSAGYYNATIGIDYYADPEMLNLQDGFVMINERSATIGRLYTFSRRYLPENAAYFLSTIAKRLTERLFHIFYFRTMPNPYGEVTQQLSTMSDMDRIGHVISLFRDINQPLFIHAHLMGTHVSEPDEYEQGVSAFDQNMRFLINELELMGRLENTLVIVYTDHGHNNIDNIRLPLMFRFPNNEYAGEIASSTQNLDISPTILDYLGIEPPAWMAGESLLRGEPEAARPIFSFAPNYRVDKNDRLQLDLSKVKPPFYQFGTVTMMICQNWYKVNTTSLAWQAGEVEGYLTPCGPEALPDEAEAKQIMLDRLEKDGFDVSSLREALAE